MHLRILSDLHFEFHRDRGAGFLKSLHAAPDEVLILAGDIAVGADLLHAIPLFCAKWRHVVFVPGNHEYYGHEPGEVHAVLDQCRRGHANFHWLDCATATLDGQRFVGATLWFNEKAGALPARHFLSDFHAIPAFEPWVYRQHERALAVLRREVRATDVVVTHHLPAQACVHPKFANSRLNPYFVHDLSDLIEQRHPKVWVHGHTHAAVDVVVGATRIVANPFGYLGHEHDTGFRPDWRVEV